ncbi:hypothetical protein HOLleu_17032 [Holothuria leucospilota]|uniref:Ig-like domain-containing protein n=1 Tax=Holothuria leucospilota TaxID=206669 RepID=A0A9Q1C7B3_HOLLE|nr:hypothetical protein HOLleu_17032 [Holothuria leucospilota]
MAHKLWLIFISTGLLLITMPFQCTSKLCPDEDFPIKPFHGSCRVEPGETLCLVCPINKSTSYVVWTRNGKLLFRGGHQVAEGNYILNDCHSILKSLEFSNVGIDQHHKEFTCSSNQTSRVRSKFIVEIEAQTALHIQEIKNGSFGDNTFVKTRSEIMLKCVLQKAFGNVTLTWTINGTDNGVYEQVHYYEDNLKGTYISKIRYRSNGGSDNVTCRSSGPYIRDETASWLFEASVPDKDARESPKAIIIVIALLVVCGVVVGLYCFQKKRKYRFSHQTKNFFIKKRKKNTQTLKQ